MLIIRLSRVGRKNDPSFRVVLQEEHRTPTGKAIEFLGFYNPRLKQKNFKTERIKYWLSQGAQTSGTLHNLLVDEKIIEAPKRKVSTTKKKKEPTDAKTMVGEEGKKGIITETPDKEGAEKESETKTESKKTDKDKEETPKKEK